MLGQMLEILSEFLHLIEFVQLGFQLGIVKEKKKVSKFGEQLRRTEKIFQGTLSIMMNINTRTSGVFG